MSQFNNPYPQQPYGQKPTPAGSPYVGSPQPSSSGSKVILIVLGIVFGIVLLIVLACGALGYMASRAVTSIGAEVTGMIVEPMANEAVQRYQDHDAVQEHIGEIRHYHFENPGIDVVNRPVLRLEVEGEKGQGKIVFYRRNGRPQKVVLEVDGQEILLDDNPKELFQPDVEPPRFDVEPPLIDEPSKANELSPPKDAETQEQPDSAPTF
ncbi:MAG: hypothetical protein Q8M16_14875 [Pirellulaceae bacterium]|nr:hypothetical protein [Pirellulaceae bacterium]